LNESLMDNAVASDIRDDNRLGEGEGS
jgi:hypothetical protein